MYSKLKKYLFLANVLSEKSNPDPSLIAKSRSMSKRVKLNVGGIRCKSKNRLKNISKKFQTWNNVEDRWHLAFFKTRFIGKGTSYWPWVYQNIFYCFRQKLMKRSCSCVMTIHWWRMNTSLTDIQDHSTQSSTFTELGNFTLLMRCVFLLFSKEKYF